jgi:hypothetical protein
MSDGGRLARVRFLSLRVNDLWKICEKLKTIANWSHASPKIRSYRVSGMLFHHSKERAMPQYRAFDHHVVGKLELACADVGSGD